MPVETQGASVPQTCDELLAMRVSEVLKLHVGALDVLLEHGFTPLAQTHLRALLAPTLTLAQAIRLKSLSAAEEGALVGELLQLLTVVDTRETENWGATCL